MRRHYHRECPEVTRLIAYAHHGVPTLPQAVRLGWEPAWVALAVLTISLSLMTTILAGIASRKIHKRTLFFFGLLGVTKPLIASDCL